MIPSAVRKRILVAVDAGTVTPHEADAYLQHQYGVRLEAVRQQAAQRGARTKIAAIAALFTIIALVAAFLLPGDLTGMLVLDDPEDANGAIAIPAEVTSLRVSGILYGDGNATIYLDTQNATLLVGTVMSDDGTPRTDRPSYAPGENISVQHVTGEASYYFDDGSGSIAVELPLAASVNGTLLVIVNGSGELRTYTLPIIIGEAPRETRFSQLCEETCAMDATNGTIRVVGDVQLTRIDAQEENRAPTLAVELLPVTVENATTLNLSRHFIDPDGDALMYTTGSSDIARLRVNGSLLTIAPLRDGSENLTIYASDLRELVPAVLQLTVIAPTANGTEPEETLPGNSTPNGTDATPEMPPGEQTPDNTTNTSTPPERNESINPTGVNLTDLNGTNASTQNLTGNATQGTLAGCDDPDVNQRPNYCLLNTSRMLEEDLFWEDVDRNPVARITELGNLMLTGKVIENDLTGRPGPNEFSIGYTNTDFDYVPTIWVSGGDLHLRGRLYEERKDFIVPPGNYIASNRRGINLAYAERTTGDLYLRGNVIQYRKTIQVN